MDNKSEFDELEVSPKSNALSKLDAVINNRSVLDQQYDFLIKDNPNLPDNLRQITPIQFLKIVKRMKAGLVAVKSCVVDGKKMGDYAIPLISVGYQVRFKEKQPVKLDTKKMEIEFLLPGSALQN